jgi:aryl-alcohol dehydrogenase-like predicted oxidoreductase
VLPFFPLESGLLTGKYRRGDTPPPGSRMARPEFATWLARTDWDRIEALEQYAKQRRVTVLDVAIGGLLAKDVVSSVIAGATSAEQVRRNAEAAAWRPTADDLRDLHAILDA